MPRFYRLHNLSLSVLNILSRSIGFTAGERKNLPSIIGKIRSHAQPRFSPVAFVLLTLLLPSIAEAQHPVTVSVRNEDVLSGSGRSDTVSISANGRFVAFHSRAFNLVKQKDDNGTSDVFVRDLQLGTTTLVSVRTAGDSTGNGGSFNPVISADGRYVAFQSEASNLTTITDTNFVTDVFVRDLQTGTTTLLSHDFTGTRTGNGTSISPVISANGRVVVFTSTARDLIPSNTNTYSPPIDLYAKDLQTGITQLVSVNSAGTGGGNSPVINTVGANTYFRSIISADGRFVVFETNSTNLVSLPDNNGTPDIFMRDLQAGTTSLISVNSAGTGAANGGGTTPIISADGRYVAFLSQGTTLVNVPDTNGTHDLFIRDTQTNTTKLVTYNSAGTAAANNGGFANPVMSADGRYVAFQGFGSDYVPNDNNNKPDIFVRDMVAGVTKLVSIDVTNSTSSNGTSMEQAISADGRFVVFASDATDLVNMNDTNARLDVFVRDLQTNTTNLLSINKDGTGTVADGSRQPVISANGKIVTFESSSPDLADHHTPNSSNIFAVAVKGRARFSPRQYSVDEQNGDISVTVVRNDPSDGPATINIVASNGTASSGSDFTPLNETLNFSAGESSKTIVIHVNEDTTDEVDETVGLIISDFADSSASGTLSTATLTITDNDAPPTISINDVTVAEGESEGVIAVFDVTLSQASGKEISVGVTVTGVTAQSGSDFNFNGNRLLIAPGQTSGKISIPIVGDFRDEIDETFTVNLTEATNATILRSQGTGTILDNDPAPSFYIYDATLTEGNSGGRSANFLVLLTGASGKPITIDYATSDLTAVAGSDYVASSGTLNFSPGQTQKIISVIINSDTLDETNETFAVNLTNAQNASPTRSLGFGTIVNDDGPVIQLSSTTYTINEGLANTTQGFTSLAVNVTRSGDTSAAATVQYSTSDTSGGNECNQVTGQASQRCDYATQAGTLRFAAGEASKTIQIPIINDGYQEGTENFILKLQNPTGGTLSIVSQATITIDDDPADATPTTGSNNPYLNNEFFVRMNYLDFLAREPDAEGWNTWTGVLNNCGPEKGFLGAPKNCDRAFVSHGFIASAEFTDRGYRIYRMYEVALSRLPRYSEFVPDMAAMSGAPGSAELEQNTNQFADSFTNRAEFTGKYSDVSSPAQAALFIARLEQNAGVQLPATTTTLPGQPPQYGRQELINKRASGELSLGQTLRAFVEQKVVYDRFFERGFVTMQYFGFLRRDPDLNDPNLLGWTEWVFVFTNGGAARNRPDILARDIHHLTFGFIYSEEYRKRFGQP